MYMPAKPHFRIASQMYSKFGSSACTMRKPLSSIVLRARTALIGKSAREDDVVSARAKYLCGLVRKKYAMTLVMGKNVNLRLRCDGVEFDAFILFLLRRHLKRNFLWCGRLACTF